MEEKMIEVSLKNVKNYRPWTTTNLFPVERRVLPRILFKGARVLDAGCGAGRLFPFLTSLGCEVFGVDLNVDAVAYATKAFEPQRNIRLFVEDIRHLPSFSAKTFDVVIASANVLDFLYPASEYGQALFEINRVLKMNGWLFFSSHNPIGTLLSPRGLRVPRLLSWRWRYLSRSQHRAQYFEDPNGLILYQATPESISMELEKSGFRLVEVFTRSGWANPLIAKLFSAWPFYLAQKM
jgi:SAM-dependent methyltransferase